MSENATTRATEISQAAFAKAAGLMPGGVSSPVRAFKAVGGTPPFIKEAEGFLAYYALNAGAGEFATVSVFEDQAGAEESIRMAADWVMDNLAALLPNPPEITA